MYTHCTVHGINSGKSKAPWLLGCLIEPTFSGASTARPTGHGYTGEGGRLGLGETPQNFWVKIGETPQNWQGNLYTHWGWDTFRSRRNFQTNSFWLWCVFSMTPQHCLITRINLWFFEGNQTRVESDSWLIQREHSVWEVGGAEENQFLNFSGRSEVGGSSEVRWPSGPQDVCSCGCRP